MERFKGICREAGLKLTHQRLEIYRELAGDTGHPSAEEVYRRVRDRMPTIALDTVYRTLSTFEKVGAIARVDVFDERARFDANLSPHQHFICTMCHAIMDFTWDVFEGLDLPAAVSRIGRIDHRSVIVRGICHNCFGGTVDGD